ncbi:MAG: tubulin-like doman-containing protein [Oscillospiraceae bacterium]|nr:tubulin-like doman-containing protein [Oscillospiraceae bacterium]
MYEKLLLHRDGGIIDARQQYEQDNCAVLAIGLGGTGVDCLKNLKAKVYNRLKPDNPDSTVPEYSHIKFLLVDTDKTGLTNANNKSTQISRIDLDTEFFDISHSGDMTKVFEANKKSLSNDPAYKEWLEHDRIKVKVAAFGAGGVRQLGRYLFMEKVRAFTDEVCAKVRQAMTGLTDPEVYVHIFSGISGGTGAGIFLDASYLVRHCLKDLGISANICGYFFLPDVNLSKPGIDNEASSYIKVNGYASMKEFDYCTNFERNGDKWSQYYPGIGTVESIAPPVDICHLITAQDSSGNVIDGAYHYAMNVVTDYFMEFVAKTNEDFTLKSHISNYVSKKEEINKKHGAMYEYCALGASSATLPFKEVITYLSAKMFREFDRAKSILPSKNEFEDFVNKNALSYNALENQLKAGVNMAFPIPDVRWQDAITDEGLTTEYFDIDCLQKAEKALSQNFDVLTREITDYSIAAEVGSAGNTSGARSVSAKVFDVLKTIMLNYNKGPYYAAAILRHTLGGDLIALFSAHIEQARIKLQQELVNQEAFEEDRIEARELFHDGSTNMLNGKKRYAAYCHCSREYALLQARISVYSKMVDAMELLKIQLNKLANVFTDVFRDTVERLINTFSANYNYLESEASKSVAYEFPIARIEDLRDSLDRTIKAMEVGEKMSEFMALMLSPRGIKAWITGNENDIVRLVTKYFTTLFNENSKKTMTQYLQEKYKTPDPEQLKKAIREDIMQDLDGKSAPLFWTSDMYDINAASRVGFISAPSESSEVIEAAKLLSNKDESLTVRVSDITDRITVIRCLVGVPLYGYLGLLQYENRSAESTKIGKHLYEGRGFKDGELSKTGRNWHILPSPSPLSTMNSSNNSELRSIAEKARKLYAKAEDREIIVKGDNGKSYWIKVITGEFVKRARTLYEESKASNLSAEERYKAHELLKALTLEFSRDESHEIENDGYAELPESNKRDVRIDHFAAAPKYREIVQKQLDILTEYDRWVEASAPKVDIEFDDFTNAIFAGVIVIDGSFIKYADDLTGEDVFLSKPSMQKGAIPLYQALENYRAADAQSKRALNSAVAAILDEYPIPTKVGAACDVVAREVSQEVLGRRLASFTASNPEETGRARQFFERFIEKLSAFMSRYLNL